MCAVQNPDSLVPILAHSPATPYNIPVLAVLNILFLAFHTGLIVFNVFGWIWPKTRRWNLLTQLLTLSSWLIMGAFKGIGYCLCTDIHWKIRQDMGITDDPNTYIGFLIQKVTGTLPSDAFIFNLTLAVFVVSFIASITLNFRDWKRRSLAPARP